MPPKDPELLRLERRAHAIGTRIGAPAAAYPPFGQRLDAGYPNVLRRDGAWVWEAHERGVRLQHRVTQDEDEILYWIFAAVARWMGSTWAREHRRPDLEDSRVVWAGRTLELLAELDPRWLERFLREEDAWLSTIRWPGGVAPAVARPSTDGAGDDAAGDRGGRAAEERAGGDGTGEGDRVAAITRWWRRHAGRAD